VTFFLLFPDEIPTSLLSILFHSVLRAETAAICAVSTTAAAIDYLGYNVNDGHTVEGQ
jgi:hypothetical protein